MLRDRLQGLGIINNSTVTPTEWIVDSRTFPRHPPKQVL
jgi:hypothetical protein